MPLLDESSLGRTVEALNDALFLGLRIAKPAREELARFIASRQGLPRSYHGLFAPTDGDFKQGLTLFTGEHIDSGAGVAHILGQEAYRALLLLDVHTRQVTDALASAAAGMGHHIHSPEPDRRGPGMFCCGRCSVSVWRALLAGAYGGSESFIAGGLRSLSRQRDGQGRWRVFPFWYTLLALSEMPDKTVFAELRYAAPLLQRAAKRVPRDDAFARRRHVLAERVLAKC